MIGLFGIKFLASFHYLLKSFSLLGYCTPTRGIRGRTNTFESSIILLLQSIMLNCRLVQLGS